MLDKKEMKRLLGYIRKRLGGYADLHAEDVLQDSFVQLLSLARPDEIGDKELRVLYWIARRRCSDLIRSERARIQREDRWAKAWLSQPGKLQEFPLVGPPGDYEIWILRRAGFSKKEIAQAYRMDPAQLEELIGKRGENDRVN